MLTLCLLLDYDIRKGALCAIQFKHFDHQRERLTIFTRRFASYRCPIQPFWKDLEHHILNVEARPDHYLLCRHRTIPVGKPDATGKRRTEQRRLPDKPMSPNGAHLWWYACLQNAGIVPQRNHTHRLSAKPPRLRGFRAFSGDGGNRTHVRDRVRMASTSVAGALISSLASLAGRVARDQPPSLSPD
jgi:hypothetical protein